MSEVWVDEAGLDALASGVTTAGETLATGRTSHASAVGGDLGLASARHQAAVDRWQGGLATAVAALAETAAAITACAASYRASDDDQSIVFTGVE